MHRTSTLPTAGVPLARLRRLTLAYFVSEERCSALALLVTTVLLNLSTVYLAVQYNQWYQLFFNALERRSQPDFWVQLMRFGIIAGLNVAAVAYRIYCTQILEMRWRKWLTHRYMGAWLQHRAYYWIEVTRKADNPDQRIADDLRQYISGALGLSLGLLNAVVSLFSFVTILWTISGPLHFSVSGHPVSIAGYMVWAAILYAAAGSLLAHLIGKPLVGLNVTQQRYEADFRFALQRLRENAEGVALYGGETSEHTNLKQHFSHVLANWRGLIGAQTRLNWVTSGYGQLAAVFPFLVAAPRFFAETLTLGGLMQVTDSFERVRVSLSWFVENYSGIAGWRASVERLLQFDAVIDSIASKPQAVEGIELRDSAEGEIRLQDCDLALPNGDRLVTSMDFAIRRGERILLAGPSGTGKSTLFRAIAGIWTFGRGALSRPPRARMLFLPQRPYMPIGTLRDAVSYPAAGGTFSDATIVQVLQCCQLPDLAMRLSEIQPWGQQLSPGEQQRLAVARAVLHEPDWLFLDEATSALDEATESAMYVLLHRHLPKAAIISIAHRSAVHKYHDKRLTFESAGRTGPVPRAA